MGKKENERKIIKNTPNRRPYGAKLTFLVEKTTNFKIDGECLILTSREIHLRIKPKNLGAQKENEWEIFVEGFATASEAENIGLKVAMGFLWTAIKGGYSRDYFIILPSPVSSTIEHNPAEQYYLVNQRFLLPRHYPIFLTHLI